MRDLDPALLRTFVAVIDAGGFTRAAERVHRTQSTVSQQVQRLEDVLGTALLERSARSLRLTDDGARLEGYARRILALNDAACAAFTRDRPAEVVRIGLTEDYAVEQLPRILARIATEDDVQLQVRCDISATLCRDLEAGDLDLALVKQLEPPAGALAVASVALRWFGQASLVPDATAAIPLAVFPHGCVYRNHAIHVLEAAGRPWHVAYASPNLSGIQAAVLAGLGVSPLSAWEVVPGIAPLPEHCGLPALPEAHLVLHAAPRLGRGARRVADLLAESLGQGEGNIDAAPPAPETMIPVQPPH